MRKLVSMFCSLAVFMTLFAGLSLPSAVSAETSGDFEYTPYNDGTAAITGYTGSATELTIPSILDGYTVTWIKAMAFYNCSGITSVTIPYSVTTIGSEAFSNCTSLENITLPDSITYMDAYVFDGTAYYNEESNWDNGVLYIGNHLVASKDANGECIVRDGTKTIAPWGFKKSSITGIKIPDSVVSIGYCAFQNCEALTNVSLSNNVKSIAYSTFYGCTSLNKITLPDNLGYIDTSAFANCSSLTSITIPKNVTIIELGAFRDCSSLSNIVLPNSKIDINSGAFTGTAYYNDPNNWENDVLYIGKHLITANENLTGIYTVKNDTATIARFAFADPLELKGVVIPETVEQIGISLFINLDRVDPVTVYGYADSYAQQYATENNIPFVIIDKSTLGDLNADGEVNLNDATMLFYYVNGLTTLAEDALVADMNEDGTVNLNDATTLFYRINGLV